MRWNLADPARRRDLYEIVLVEGTLHDIRDLAAAKDSGFTTGTFIDALRAIHRLGPADWAEDGLATRLDGLFDERRVRLTRSDAR